MNTLIERGAIALLHFGHPKIDWASLRPRVQDRYLSMSRACLEAFRVPTEKMIRAGNAAGFKAGVKTVSTDVWQAMADAERETDT